MRSLPQFCSLLALLVSSPLLGAEAPESLWVEAEHLDGIEGFCWPMGRPEMTQDPRFLTPSARRANWPAMSAAITGWLDRFPSADDALAALMAARVPCAPVLSPREVIDHPHLEARGFFPSVAHEGRGTVRVTATPFHVDGRAPGPAGPAPYRVGEHTRAVLGGLARYPAARIEELLAQGVAVAP